MRLAFQKMTHGKTPRGEYLLLIFSVEDPKRNAYFLLSPNTDADLFAERFLALTGRAHTEYRPQPRELEELCRNSEYEGEAEERDGFLQISELSRL
jgi:hypothetical protein